MHVQCTFCTFFTTEVWVELLGGGWDLGMKLHVCTYSAQVHVVYPL